MRVEDNDIKGRVFKANGVTGLGVERRVEFSLWVDGRAESGESWMGQDSKRFYQEGWLKVEAKAQHSVMADRVKVIKLLNLKHAQ